MEEKINLLKEKLKKFTTSNLLGMIGIHFLTFANGADDVARQADIFNKTKLTSPQKQYTYLAGLLMSTEYVSGENIEYDSDIESTKQYEELEDAVQEITFEYIKNFTDIDKTQSSVDFNMVKKNLVAMEAFISYFDMGILRYPEQTINLMRTFYSDFDSELEELTGLVLEDYIAFYQLIFDTFSDAIISSQKAVNDMKSFLNSFNPYNSNIEVAFQKILEYQSKAGDEIQQAMDGLNTIKASSVFDTFGAAKGKILLDTFGLYRKERTFTYYNEKNPFAEHPLCWIDEGATLFIVHPQFILNAIYNYITDVLECPQNKFADKYKKSKAKKVEDQFLKCFKNIFGENAKYHTSVCEERGTKEHDILIEYGDYILIAEAKASKVREPLFNPAKSYNRIKDHFNSDTGIGGAYNQAIILKKFIENKQSAILYENKSMKFVIENASTKTILPIVLTLNQFGGLAVNTSLILEKDEDQPYPWVCNWHDFDNIIEILKYLNKSPQEFMNYILWRIDNHPKILSTDELDVVEGYFTDNQLKKNIKKSAVSFPPNGASLIDKIYFEKQGIAYHHPAIPSVRKKKIGRNELCPCGSQKKFKKCCIGKWIYD